MPSNFTIAKTLKRVAYYREICGHDAGQYPGAAMEAQFLQGRRIDEITDETELRRVLNEADEAVLETVREIVAGAEVSALKEDVVPLTILEITEIKGVGAKMAKRAYEDAGVVDLQSLKIAMEAGSLGAVKGFGPKMLEKIAAHLAAVEKKGKGR